MDYDDQIKLAMQLSLEEEKRRRKATNNKQGEVLVISDDDDDDDDDDIVEISAPKPKPKAPPSKRASSQPKERKRASQTPAPQPKAPTPPPAPSLVGAGPLSFLGDRAQMERDRLARQKRLRPPSPPRTEQHSSGEDDYDDDDDADRASEGSRKRARLDAGPASNMTDDGRRLFPDGALLRIDTQYATDAQTPSIRLTDILGPKQGIAFAIMSAFQVDPVWLYSFFDPATPVVLVTDPNMCGAKGDPADASGHLLKHILPNWVRVCPQLHRSGPFEGCMHMKYMLLFLKNGSLRVVVSSANLVPYDWRDIENYTYIQDFPPAIPGTSTISYRPGEKAGEAFPEVLADVLQATGVGEALIALKKDGHTSLPLPSLSPATTSNSNAKPPSSSPASSSKPHSILELGWDWRKAHSGRVALVASVSGKADGWAGTKSVLRYGQARLLRAVVLLGAALEDLEGAARKKLKARAKGKMVPKDAGKGEIELDCLASSLGTYDAPWIAGFRLCAGGRPKALQAWLDREKKKTTQQGPTRILYPTVETINLTTLGQRGAGTLFCRPNQWKKMQEMGGVGGTGVSGLRLMDGKSRCGPVAMHTKMILGTLPKLAVPEADTDDSATESESDSDGIEIVEPEPTPTPHAWLYSGSHNFTAAAWGRLTGSGFNPTLTMNNYELGVVLRMDSQTEVDKAVAWAHPPRPYIRGDDPWIQPSLRQSTRSP
ncbi:hypothetical protein MKEN_01345100 [Mycena kentingensis (nom. inval.)]|nr:hypothetical protein MKEN_01345100 [Mycena kentingensis (nom. inval.)]